jgi:LysM repeat protein
VLPSPTLVTGPGGSASSGAIDDVTYVVEAGDAISSIAARFGVPADVIREANGIVGNDIFVGQVLRIPRTTGGTGGTGPAPAPTSAPGAPGTYVVQPGDTAFGIALQFDVTLESLEQANGVGPGGLDALSLGQVLRIPASQ